MANPLVKKLIVFLLCLVFANQTYGQKPPDFNEIVAKFIEKGEADSLYIGDSYSHYEQVKTQTLKSGVVSEIKKEFFRVEKRNGGLYKKLIEKNGLAVTDSGFKKKDEIVDIGIKLLERYEFAFLRDEILDGVRCWVFSFRPKDNLPDPNIKDAALNRMAGEVWVGKHNLIFKKITGHLLSEANISKFIGSAHLYKLDFVITAKSIDGRFAVDHILAEYIYTAKLFGFITVINNRHEITEIFYENYERR